MIEEIGCDIKVKMFYHLKKPGFDLDYGLLALGNDQDVLNMIAYVGKVRLIHIYVEHGITTVSTYWRSPQQSTVVIEEIPEDSPVKVDKVVKQRISFKMIEGCCSRVEADIVNEKNQDVEDVQNQDGEDVHEPVNEKEIDDNPFNDSYFQDDYAEETETFHKTNDDNPFNDPVNEDEQEDDFVEDEINQMHDVEVDMSKFCFSVEREGTRIEPHVAEIDDDDIRGIDFDEFDSGGSDEPDSVRKMELRKIRREHARTAERGKTKFYLTQSFVTKKQVTDLVRCHAVETRRNLKLVKSDKKRINSSNCKSIPKCRT